MLPSFRQIIVMNPTNHPRGEFMARTFLFGTCLMLAAAIGACALFQESPEQRAKRIEPMLSAAGFHMIPADNDQKVSAIQPLPPLRMRYYAKNGKLSYWFADRDYCHCVFVGDEGAYQRYENLKIQKQLAQQQEMTAEENEQAAEQMMMPPPFFWY
jgi:hypothetical protein